MKKTQVEIESRVIRGAHGVAAEEDHILTGTIARIGVVALAIFFVGGIWAWRIQAATLREVNPTGPAPIPAPVGQYEIGIVNQRLFQQDTHAEEKLRRQQQALENGWAEEPGVAARPTISQAMDQVIQEQAARRQQEQTPPEPEPAPEQ
jgi:hypothetical protein